MDDVIRIHDRYYILATSGLSDDRTRVLKHGDTFVVFDRYGDIQPVGLGQQGLFQHGTRHLSRLDLRFDRVRPMLLGSALDRDNAMLVATLTNPDLQMNGHLTVARNTVHVERSSLLFDGTCYIRCVVRNFELVPIDLTIAVTFEADFADIFEVRGVRRPARGRRLEPVVDERSVHLAYEGLDGVTRRTVVRVGPAPVQLGPGRADFSVHLPPAGERSLEVMVDCHDDGQERTGRTFVQASHGVRAAMAAVAQDGCTIRASNPHFNDWITRSAADLAMMITQTPHGLYPYAGVPWFCTPFGRDGLITALETLWANPAVAKGVLRFLAASQATEFRPEVDAEPGKIVHEMRDGEMAACGEIPFARYYGSVDATPLFVMLAAAYFDRTGDQGLVEDIWPNVVAALDWIDEHGDADRDGFVEYARRSRDGLRNQGWKDSEDAIFHDDGSLAEGPIALCEVQAYVYGAKRGAARLARLVGERERAQALAADARSLRVRFEEAFWDADLSTYVLALDGTKRPCRVRTSNAGHCLFTGIAGPGRARAVATVLMDADLYSGWGIRTVATNERRYNPMSYHDGSVWPHDNALIAAGMARYRLPATAEKLLQGLFDACQWTDMQRLPELFCGFPRHPAAGPTLYPVACAPQAWSSGAVYLLLASCLGLEIDGPERRIRFSYSRLPPSLETVWITGLRVGEALIDLELRRHGDDVGVNVTRRDGQVEVVTVK